MNTSSAEEICLPSYQLGIRAGREACWIRYPLTPNDALCVSRGLWQAILAEAHPPIEGCANWKGKWKVHATLKNSARAEKVQKKEFLVKSSPSPPIGGHSWVIGMKASIERIREAIAARLEPRDTLGIWRRLILDQRGSGDWEGVLRATGFVHLYLASGIHLYALQGWIRSLGFLGFTFFRIPLGLASGLSYFVSTIAWILLWILSGMRLGLLRPLWVCGVKVLAQHLGFRWRWWAPLLIVVVVELLLGWQKGGTHYALAIYGGLAARDHLKSKQPLKAHQSLSEEWRQHAALSLGSWVPTLFLDCFESGRISLATPIISLLSIPVFSWLLPFSWLPGTLEVGNQWVLWLFSAVQNLKWVWVVPPSYLLLALVMAVPLLFLARRWTWVFLISCLILRGSLGTVLRSHDSLLTQLDVGQGDAALLSIPFHAGMIDVGSRWSLKDLDWIEVLSKRNVTHLEWVGLTHLDEDHRGGLDRLSNLLPIGCVAAPGVLWLTPAGKQLQSDLVERRITVESLQEGEPSRCIPFPFHIANKGTTRNNGVMMGVSVPLGPHSIYVNLGDASASMEREFESKFSTSSEWKNARKIMKISHHGSRYSSEPDFLKAIHPEQIFISSGVGNTYGHPTPLVLNHLSELRIPIRRTDREGYLELKLGTP